MARKYKWFDFSTNVLFTLVGNGTSFPWSLHVPPALRVRGQVGMSGSMETTRIGLATDGPQAMQSRSASKVVSPGIFRHVPAAEIQIFFAIVLLAGIFSYTFPDSFATSGTLLNMARVAGILLVVSIGQSFALIVGGFDISVGATMGLVSVICALLMRNGVAVTEAVGLGVLAGAAVGLINGIGISILGVTPFVMTLGILTSVRGLADQLANGRVITGFPRDFALFGRAAWWGVPSAACIAVVMLVIAWLILQRTRAGLYIFSIGGSRETTRVAGVFVELYEALAYTLCGTMAGVGGVMLTSRVAVAQGSLGQGYELLSVATAVIGGVLIGGGVGRLTGVVLGVVLITVLNTGLDIAGVNPFVQQIVTGLVLISAVLLSKARAVSIRALVRQIALPRRG
jgi:ribose/xylose/arabinose/galactoside ABC-type transport system permease subunit